MQKTMRKTWLFASTWIVCLVLSTATCFAAHGKEPQDRKAILLVAFGTSVPQAQKVFDKIDSQAKQRFPGTEIRWAFTSGMIRAKLAKQGQQLDSPEMALSKLMNEGFTHVAVLSLQTIPGREFHDLYQNAKLFGQMAGGFRKVLVAPPLLSSHDDMVRVAKGIIKNLPPERKPEDAVLLMGHGNEKHPSDALYLAMAQVFAEVDPGVFLATVEGYPSINDVLPGLEKRKSRKVFMMPFMLVAGDHAMNDMAGDSPESWKSILGKAGYQCEVILRGTGDYPEIVDVWLDHLQEVYAGL